MKIAVINLASDAARWRAVERQFKAVGLDPVRLEAVAGPDLKLRQLDGLYCEQTNRRQYHKPLRSGEIGCYASHMLAWQGLLRSGDSCLAVFEDDVEIAADLPRVLDVLSTGTGDWDVAKLIGRPVEQAQPLLAGRDLIRYRRVPSLTSAYVISRRGAAKLLARRLPFGRPVDVDMRHWWECDLRIAGVYPYPVSRAPSSQESTIENRRVPVDLAMRVHKLYLQMRYSVLNWQAGLVAGRAPAAGPAARPRAVGDAVVRHDAA